MLRLLIMLTLLHGMPAVAAPEFSPSSVEKGVFLVASPSLTDPNFRQTVVLVLEHGPEGTVGLILNRSTEVLLSEALPDVSVLKGTMHRLYAGGPVQPNILLLLSRLTKPQPNMRSVLLPVPSGMPRCFAARSNRVIMRMRAITLPRRPPSASGSFAR